MGGVRAIRWPALSRASGSCPVGIMQPSAGGQRFGSMSSETRTRDSAGDVRLVTTSRSLALPGRPLDHITRPVLNRPHEEPSRHWQLADDNTSTGVVIDGRRLSQALVIVPKERGSQLRMQPTAGEQNELVNRIRDAVAGWRSANYPGATSATRQLLQHWRSETNDPRLFFCSGHRGW